MAGNLLYIPYTIILVIVLIVVGVVIQIKYRKLFRKFLAISLPMVMIVQFYFWNVDFNRYVKSYLFSSKVFKFEHQQELKGISIPLPNRTVLLGKEDGCSPYYITYVEDKEFISFYMEELERLEKRAGIDNYSFLERNEEKGFTVELPSNSKIDIMIHRKDSEDNWLLSIYYNSKRE
ncbi:hypothetical protein [Alkalihalobacillus sp. AL-G]|uniref:hypothetical protein n=1 Tax=Alkalihalobacillus sp. AL-G TaxID=2926399 RepID=UPI00272A6696|nr:hypothetical protein [Alkalihalobacillus sp. AL-G]WLD93768.1 hypothetical protein MOJ78_02290 [Alkalihalobacillus sp. AL-G]